MPILVTSRLARSLVSLLLALAVPALDAAAAEPRPAATARAPGLEDFQPRGTVKHVRQATARFATPMVPYGDPRSVRDPFVVDCPVGGKSRWLDARTWVFDFERTLPGGVRCAFRAQPDLADLSGAALPPIGELAFDTGGPAIMGSLPSAGEEVDAEQLFVLRLDAEPTAASVEQHASFAVSGVNERVPLRVVTGDERAQLVERFRDQLADATPLVVAARRRFPDGGKVRLLWGAGIATAAGAATTEEQSLEFKVRPAFEAELRCQRESPRAGCIPLTPIVVRFTAPVTWAEASRVRLAAPDGTPYAAVPPASPEQTVSQVVFRGPFAASVSLRLDVPADLRDEAGRTLANPGELPAEVAIGSDPPLAKFASRFAIVELAADPALPVTIRDLGAAPALRELRLPAEAGAGTQGKATVDGALLHLPAERSAEILGWLRRVAAARRTRSVFGKAPPGDVRSVDLPALSGAELQVVGIPLPKPGLYVVEIASRRLGEALLGAAKPLYVPAAALVTDMAVHFEWGRAGSLVWVTRLSDATPVGGAHVAVHDCAGRVLWSGTTGEDGIARIARLPDRDEAPVCRSDADVYSDPYYDYRATRALNGLDMGLFVTARHGDDLSFVHSSWDLGIEPFRFDLPEESWNGPYVAHAVLDRALLRAGETLHMKHLFRTQTLPGFAFATPEERPERLSIRHLGSETRYEMPLVWRDDGSAASDWTIPREAKLGAYEIYYVRPATEDPAASPQPTATPPAPYERLGAVADRFEREWLAGTFRVAEFRVPLARGTVDLPAEPQVGVREVHADLAVRLLSGGGAGDLPVVLRSQIEPTTISVRAHDDFSFGNGAVEPGIEREGAGTGAAEEGATRAIHERRELRLDAAGTARATIGNLPAVDAPKRLRAELEFRDPNGEVQTAVATVPLWPAAVVAGLDVEVREGRSPRLETSVVVLDARLAPAPRVRVQVDAFERRDYTVRKRVLGGFYAYEYVRETKPLGTLCRGRTRADGTFRCTRRSPASGNVVLQVTALDAEGRASVAHRDVWVEGDAEHWFRVGADDRIDVLPDKRRYEPGETARLQVRMPFRDATALVTVAREGVLDARVVRLSGKNPTVDVPVEDAFSPNMFVSVLAVRGRVGDVQPTARVDLGKPAFKLGVAELVVGWRPHELEVRVTTDRQAYRVRETVRTAIEVRTAAGGAPPAGSTVAVAAVDEGLLELAPNRSWNVLRAMMGQRGFGVWTSTGQMEVVGKRHYGLKARPQGGGGGRQTTRELFDTLLLWRADVPLDAAGNAELEVPLNDSLTSFRIVAVATGGTGQFGDGGTTIRTTQDLMLFSGLPPVVRSGDDFTAEITLRNTTASALAVEVGGRADGIAEPLAPQRLELAADESRVVGWPVAVPDGVTELRWEIEARSTSATDRLAVVQRVAPAVPVRVLQATLAQLERDRPLVLPVAAPAGALPGGGIEVALAPSLLGGLDGARRWMERYPYTCLEQRVSRAVVLEDPALWSAVAAALPSHLDDDGLLKFFPTMRAGDELLTAYVLLIARTAGLPLPDDVVERMERGLRGFVDGSLRHGGDGEGGAVDLPLRKVAVLAALASAGELDPALVEGVPIEPALWPPSTLLDWWTVLARTPAIERRAERLAEVERALHARLELGGTTLRFRDTGAGARWSVFAGGDVDAARLVLLALDAPGWRADAPRLLRGALGLQQRGAWETTVANAWGALATRAFVRAFEGEPVAGETTAELAGERGSLDWAKEPAGGALRLAWPGAPAELKVAHAGAGRPWANVLASAAIPLTEPLEAGYRVVKHIRPAEPRPGGELRAGDVLLVHLEVEARAEMPWVVVDDPVPAAASHVRGVLAASPAASPSAGEAVDPTFVERSFESYRAYFERLPAGRTVLEYAIRVNQAGRFLLPPTRAFALYAPESFAELPNAPLEVAP